MWDDVLKGLLKGFIKEVLKEKRERKKILKIKLGFQERKKNLGTLMSHKISIKT